MRIEVKVRPRVKLAKHGDRSKELALCRLKLKKGSAACRWMGRVDGCCDRYGGTKMKDRRVLSNEEGWSLTVQVNERTSEDGA